mgnify:CR=1 FL=1
MVVLTRKSDTIYGNEGYDKRLEQRHHPLYLLGSQVDSFGYTRETAFRAGRRATPSYGVVDARAENPRGLVFSESP